MALAIGFHNFPEGIATFGTALGDANLGILTAIADYAGRCILFIHNAAVSSNSDADTF